jgi:hypothetical protein
MKTFKYHLLVVEIRFDHFLTIFRISPDWELIYGDKSWYKLSLICIHMIFNINVIHEANTICIYLYKEDLILFPNSHIKYE